MSDRYYFWTKRHLELLKTPKSFQYVGEIGASVAKTIPFPVFGFSAPLTTGGYGLENNKKIIESCTSKLISYGFNVFDIMPLEIGLRTLKEKWQENNSNYCTPIIQETYRIIFQSTKWRGIFRTPNWETSEGCHGEDGIFKELQIQIFTFPPLVFKQILNELKIS